MDFDAYQDKAVDTAIYPDDARILYPILGLLGEAGEVAEKVVDEILVIQGNAALSTLDLIGDIKNYCAEAERLKKSIRGGQTQLQVRWRDNDESRDKIVKELGDVLWYVANLAADLGVPLSEVARRNLEKLNKRKAEGTIHGSGDDR